MATAGMGVGSFDNELYTARAGETLHDGRYKIIKRLLSTEQCAFPYGYATYLALDTKFDTQIPRAWDEADVLTRTSRHVCVKTLGKSASGTVSFAREQELAGGKDAASACQCLLLPIDTFQHEGHTCLVTELVGPDLFYMREAGGPSSSCFPPRWIRQVAHGALQGLKYLDGQGVVHGGRLGLSQLEQAANGLQPWNGRRWSLRTRRWTHRTPRPWRRSTVLFHRATRMAGVSLGSMRPGPRSRRPPTGASRSSCRTCQTVSSVVYSLRGKRVDNTVSF